MLNENDIPVQPPEPNASIESTLDAEIKLILSAEVPDHIIEEEIADLRYQYGAGTYQPGTSPLLPENLDQPLSILLGTRIDHSS